MNPDRLTTRALNRATLARQLLLERSPISPFGAVHHLVGLQAQNPLDPYLALWSRLADFRPDDVGRALVDRTLVRIVVMRGTIHLITAADALEFRPLTQPVLDAEMRRHRDFAPLLRGVDLAPMLDVAERSLAEQPMNGGELRAVLAEHCPEIDSTAAAYACRCHLALVQVPPRGVWGRTSAVTLAPLTAWVGAPLATAPSIDEMIVRYLTAFGPATVADVAAWSRLTGLGEVVDRLGGRLRRFVDDRGRTLHDVPDGPLPDEDVPAPVRFLPEYDNVLLSHADRSRFDDEVRFDRTLGPAKGVVLIDGRRRAIWRTERRRGHADIVVEHGPLAGHELAELEAEAALVASFWAHDADTRDVRLVPLARA